MTVQIRKMMASDYADAYAFWKAMPGMGLSSADSAEAISSFLLRNPETCFIAQDDDKLVGTVLGGSDGRRGYLYHLAVHPAYQKHGIGRQLAGTCLDALHSQGIQKCHIFVLADNQGGLNFWQKVGWKIRTDIKVLSKSL